MDDGIRLGGAPVFSSAYGLYDLRFICNSGCSSREVPPPITLPLIHPGLFLSANKEKSCKYDTLIAVRVRDDETAPPREGKKC